MPESIIVMWAASPRSKKQGLPCFFNLVVVEAKTYRIAI